MKHHYHKKHSLIVLLPVLLLLSGCSADYLYDDSAYYDEESESNYENQIVKASRKIDKIEKNKITDFLKKIYYKING